MIKNTEKTKQYILQNETYYVCVDSLGAELKSLKYHDEEYLYQGDSKYWNRSSPILFPIVGKLKEDTYTYKNKTYSLPKHGFARDSLFTLIFQNEDTLCFVLTNDEKSLESYPFGFILTLIYSLKNDGLVINYKVSSSDDIFFSLGAHPAFLLKAPIDDSFIEFEKEESEHSLALDIQSGCISNESLLTLDSNKLSLNKDIFQKDALIFKNLNSRNVSLKNSVNAKTININFDGFDYLALWAPNNAPFVCIEPWCGVADHINTKQVLEEKDAIIYLKKDECFSKSLSISLNNI